MLNNPGFSLADVAAVTRNNEDGFGGGNGWWVLIILFALFGGWGNRGWGGNGGEGSNVGAEVQRGFDTSAIISKLDGINNGICSLGYDQLNQMNGINSTIMQTGFGLQQSITQSEINAMQNNNALATQIAQCCCENRQGQAELKFQSVQDTCAITQAINQAAQNIIQNDNANYRQLHDEQIQLQIQGYKERIAEQQSLIQSLNLAASQANQTRTIIDAVRPNPIPAFNVPNPFSGCGCYAYNGCGNGCNSSF